MGSSYASDLRSGYWPEVAVPLNKVCADLRGVISKIYEATNEECQYDNAADTGALAGQLGAALMLIKDAMGKSYVEAPAHD